MAWSKIAFEGGVESPDCLWARTIFQHLYETATEAEFDDLALYAANEPTTPCTLYLSPRASARMLAAMPNYNLTPCERPDTEAVRLVIGEGFAWRTEWCELSPLEREEWREDEKSDAYHEAAHLGMLTLEELHEGDEEFYHAREPQSV